MKYLINSLKESARDFLSVFGIVVCFAKLSIKTAYLQERHQALLRSYRELSEYRDELRRSVKYEELVLNDRNIQTVKEARVKVNGTLIGMALIPENPTPQQLQTYVVYGAPKMTIKKIKSISISKNGDVNITGR